MYKLLTITFSKLPAENKFFIWQRMIACPMFNDLLVAVLKEYEKQYLHMPEPETFEPPDMAKNFAEKRQLKAAMGLIEEFLDIDKNMRQHTDKINTTTT